MRIDAVRGLEALVVEMDVLHAPDQHAGAPHGSAHLQAADIVEARLHAVYLGGPLRAEIADLHREDQEGCESGRDECAEPEIYCCSFHVSLLRAAWPR